MIVGVRRWAQLDSAARYFLPREEEKCKVGLEQKKQKKKFAEKKEEWGRLVLVLRRTGKGPEDYNFLPAKV